MYEGDSPGKLQTLDRPGAKGLFWSWKTPGNHETLRQPGTQSEILTYVAMKYPQRGQSVKYPGMNRSSLLYFLKTESYRVRFTGIS